MGHLRKDYPKRVTAAPPPKTTAPIQPNNKKTYAKAVAQPTPVHYPHPFRQTPLSHTTNVHPNPGSSAR
ncbi:10181_t:CDS:1, partial [Paraglomus brasilianum]